MLTRGGEMQKMSFFLSLRTAKATPTDITAGRAGGTVIVIKSSDLSIITAIPTPDATMAGIVKAKPKIAMKAIMNTKRMASW